MIHEKEASGMLAMRHGCIAQLVCLPAPASALSRMADMDIPGVSGSASTLRWMIAGLPDFCAAAKAAGKSAVFSTSDAEAAEGLRVSGEVGVLQFGADHAAGIFALLVHADRAVGAVVPDHDDRPAGRIARPWRSRCRSSGSRRRRRRRRPCGRDTASSSPAPPAIRSPSNPRSGRPRSRTCGSDRSD